MKRKKTEVLRSLPRTKLILGNGFDLYCGLKTSYKDYFSSLEDENKRFHKFVSDFDSGQETFFRTAGRNSNTIYDFWKKGPDLKNYSFWNFFFFLINQNGGDSNEKKWCDIEQVMCSWLLSNDSKFVTEGKNFDCVYNTISNGEKPLSTVKKPTDYLACFLYLKHGRKPFQNKTEFYTFLKNELTLFERNFGQYIFNQQHVKNRIETTFEKRSYATLKKLCNPESIRNIDTFNYGVLPLKDDRISYHHINGDTNNPIFGVDSDAFRAPDPRYIFTKTSRRMELDMSSFEAPETRIFENVVVFGSSLAPADYNYFFSIFDKLDIANINSPSKLVFAYSIYDREKTEQIKMNLTKSIFQLFQEYSTYKGNSAHPNRLLDSLTTQGKVILFNINISKHG